MCLYEVWGKMFYCGHDSQRLHFTWEPESLVFLQFGAEEACDVHLVIPLGIENGTQTGGTGGGVSDQPELVLGAWQCNRAAEGKCVLYVREGGNGVISPSYLVRGLVARDESVEGGDVHRTTGEYPCNCLY